MKTILSVIINVLKTFSFLFQLFFNCYTISRYVYNFNTLKKQVKRKNCSILANGPSLDEMIKEQSNELFENDLFCVNSFVQHTEFLKLRPKYLVWLDPLYFKDDISKEIEKIIKNDFIIINEFVNWDLTIFVPATDSAQRKMNNYVSNKNVSFVFMKSVEYDGFNNLKKILYNFNLSSIHAQNVLVRCIFLAINLNYKKINILGADHNWIENLTVNEDNKVCIRDVHFNNQENKVLPYFKGNNNSDVFKLHEILFLYSKMFLGYHQLREYSDYKNTLIINLNKKSFIDAFEKKVNFPFF